MGIWNMPFSLEQLNQQIQNLMPGILGVVFTEVGDDFLTASMPVNQHTRQPAGLLHGGASVALAETLGSIGSSMCIDRNQYHCVGLEINANHIRVVKEGFVYGTTRPLHIGSSTHVWETKITNEINQMVCISRMTTAILKIK